MTRIQRRAAVAGSVAVLCAGVAGLLGWPWYIAGASAFAGSWVLSGIEDEEGPRG